MKNRRTALEVGSGRIIGRAALSLILGCGLSLNGAVPNRLEADFSEAVLSYHARDFDGALRRLEPLLLEAPQNAEMLELQALLFSSKKSYAKAEAVYSRLIQLPKGPGEEARDLAPYYYELGRLKHEQKRYDDAVRYLRQALGLGYNSEACELLLGIIDFERRSLESSRGHLQTVIGGRIESLKPSARFYLAQLDAVSDDLGGAARHYLDAKTGARRQLASEGAASRARELSHEVMLAADKGLRSLDRTALLVNVGLLTGYDTNVLSVPNEAASTAGGGSGSPSVVETLSYGLTYASSPVAKFQFVPSYRGTLNYNFNSDTQSAQFFVHDVSLYVTRDALSLNNFGFKVGGNAILQYQQSLSSGGRLGTYSVGGSFGPYAKFELHPGWVIGVDAFFQPTKNYADSGLSASLARSGWEQTLRVFYSRGVPKGRWNPGISLTGAYNNTSGEEFRSKRVALDLGNTFFWGPKFISALGVGAGAAWYSDRPDGIRTDQSATATFTSGYRITDALTLLATLQYTRNLSSVADYRYSRFVGSLGANYLF